MSAVMLLTMTMIIVNLSIVLYCMYNLIIVQAIFFVVVTYNMNHVSQ